MLRSIFTQITLILPTPSINFIDFFKKVYYMKYLELCLFISASGISQISRLYFIICIPRIEIEDSEAVGISNIISNLITMFPRSTLTALPSDLFTSFINCLTLLTCSFGRSAALEEVVSNNTFICYQKSVIFIKVSDMVCYIRCILDVFDLKVSFILITSPEILENVTPIIFVDAFLSL